MTREEALKQIRNWSLPKETREVLQTLIPELAESEDEKIRKGLIEVVSDIAGNWPFEEHRITKKEAIAYLEKQKINTEGDFGRGYDCGYEACLNSHGAEWFEKQKEQKSLYASGTAEPDYGICDDYIPAVLHLAMARHGWYACHVGEEEGDILQHKKYVERTWPLYKDNLTQEQKEQKPTNSEKPKEWSEADNVGWDEAFACVTRAERAAKSEEELQNAVTAEKWLKEIKFKYCIHQRLKHERIRSELILFLDAHLGTRNAPAATPAQINDWIEYLENDGNYADNRFQYASISDEIKAHAETYSFNIESKLFPQLTKEQQRLWKEEIEQAVISGGEAGVEKLHSLHPQPKQEWSEEDKTNGWTGVNLERYLSCLQRLGTGNPQQPGTINSKWFKEHCRPQSKQEWSEEDEQRIAEIEFAVMQMNTQRVDTKDKCLTWLKSIRPQPHWKPSEEQMKALEDAFRKDGGNEYRKVINSLYCDLEKLL